MSARRTLARAAAIAAALLCAPQAFAEEPIRVGLIGEFSGPFAAYGKQIHGGIKAYLQQHGDTVAGRKVEIILKDTTGPAPEIAKRLAQDLVTQDKVDFLAGFGLTPNALAVAPLATQAKTPMLVMNAASSVITTRSPYVVRFSMTLPQVTMPMALWAAKNGIKKVYTIVSDYAPGLDAEAAFTKAFTAHGGEIVGSARVPLKNPDFAPFVQRAKDAAPQAVFIFVPAGEQGIAFVKAFTERGLKQAGIKLIGPGDVVVVVDHRQVPRPLGDERIDQPGRLPGQPEAPDHDGGAVGDPGDGGFERGDGLVYHWRAPPACAGPGQRRPSPPERSSPFPGTERLCGYRT